MTKLRVLDLFSGIGGFSLGLERTGGFETVAFCEIEEYPRKVLAKHWPDVPCYKDVKELTHERLAAGRLGRIDIIVGGYPCQPFSTAGQRRGAEDDRHLWPEVNRLLAEVRPRWCLFENVAGHISMGLDEVLSDLEGQGYTAQPFVIPACAVDAPHRRDRVWIIANDDRQQRGADKGKPNTEPDRRDSIGGIRADVADPDSVGRERQRGQWTVAGQARLRGGEGGHENKEVLADAEGGVRRDVRRQRPQRNVEGDGLGNKPWLPEPNVGRVANGVPRRVDRLKCLGNAVVPQIPEMIGYAILEAERNNGR